MADEFNSFFFVNIGPKLAKDIDHSVCQSKTWKEESKIMNSIYLQTVTETEIRFIVAQLKNKRSTDSDGIDMMIIKKTIDCISKPLCYIYNLSFTSGVFPNEMKTSKIIPLFKAGDKHKLTNYRPISLISVLKIIFVFVCRLDSFIEKNQLLSECQYGFRNNRSTALALLQITENITAAIENKQNTIGVFIDLKKAFDTIDHSILLKKLQTYGIRGRAWNWVRSYLENRQQFVQFAGNTSEKLKVECGIPQGSIVGPKLFILYINDLCDVSEIVQFVLFADDTNFFLSGHNLKDLVKTIEKEIVKLKMV